MDIGEMPRGLPKSRGFPQGDVETHVGLARPGSFRPANGPGEYFSARTEVLLCGLGGAASMCAWSVQMAGLDLKRELVRTAIRDAERLQYIVKTVESTLAPGSKDVEDLIRACVILLESLVELREANSRKR